MRTKFEWFRTMNEHTAYKLINYSCIVSWNSPPHRENISNCTVIRVNKNIFWGRLRALGNSRNDNRLTLNYPSISASWRAGSADTALQRRCSVGRIRRHTSGGNLVHALKKILRRRGRPIVVVHGVLRRGRIQRALVLQRLRIHLRFRCEHLY